MYVVDTHWKVPLISTHNIRCHGETEKYLPDASSYLKLWFHRLIFKTVYFETLELSHSIGIESSGHMQTVFKRFKPAHETINSLVPSVP